MDVRPVDPRDARWELDAPVYRVVLWRRQEAPCRRPGLAMMWTAREYDIVGAEDVHQVIRWAEEEAASAFTYTLAVKFDGDETGLIHLAGVDPTAGRETGSNADDPLER